jgi:hypothetical protein
MAIAPRAILEPIGANLRFSDAASVLRALQEGLQRLESEKAWLEAEQYLSRLPGDKRAKSARDRLAKLRPVGANTPDPTPVELPLAVATALELVRHGTRPPRRDPQAAIQQCETDATLVRDAICAWQPVVDGIRDELSSEVAQRLKASHRELVLRQYRSLQVLAAATDAERAFHRSITDAGYIFRHDVLVAPTLRSALLVGSESDFDSEVSRTRRLLEELKLL